MKVWEREGEEERTQGEEERTQGEVRGRSEREK
jgi:hypothetical protein